MQFTHARRRILRISSVVATIAVGALVLAGCAGASSAPQTENGLTKITLVYGAPVADHMVPTVAKAAGIFEKYGFDVDIKFLESAQLVPAMVSGDAQFVTMPAPGPEIANINGTDIVQVAQIEDSYDAMLVSNPQYATAKSLDGKTVSIAKPGDYPWLLAQMAQEKFGIDLNEIPIGSISDQIAAFSTGQVDSVGAMSPSQVPGVEAKLPGIHVIQDWRSVKGVPALQLVGYAPWLSENKDIVVKFLKAINEGVQYFTDPANEDAVVAAIADETGATEDVAKAGWENAVEAMADSIVPTEESQEGVLELLVSEFPDAQGYDASKLIDASYAEEAMK